MKHLSRLRHFVDKKYHKISTRLLKLSKRRREGTYNTIYKSKDIKKPFHQFSVFKKNVANQIIP